MINFRVFRLGDIARNLVKLMILVCGIILFTRFFSSIKKLDLKNLLERRREEFSSKTFIDCLDDNFEVSFSKNNDIEKQNVISKELDFIRTVFSEQTENTEIKEETSEVASQNTDIQETPINDEVQENPTTQVVAEHNKNDVYNTSYAGVQIRNQTSYELTEAVLEPNIEIDKSNIVVFHTHTSESYTPTEANQYLANGNFRTHDTQHSVIRVGEELKNRLAPKNINVIHDTTFHDYPEYNGAYNRSLQTVQNILANNKADIVIDLHRDALADSTYAPSVMIGEEKAAQLLFVMGCNEGGLSHPNWNDNLKMAVKIQKKANEMYPGLFKPILLTKYRYNQHVTKGACIIEVGATGNTLEECLVSMKYLAEVIESF